ncbi:hypothetical protein CAOG_009695 [Capsaspora owczarzaki ATCC 30864]|uniref:Uncharacterized protein n=1 Tax=Capsaspora owczarzaki (strain ATCC 30864) TaxID=595528 RepID=A0A0D2UCF9_CAPO3|nr:hypothetical protein CAOG_009695 [Capsaspora owczarzaki ATCC 30864]
MHGRPDAVLGMKPARLGDELGDLIHEGGLVGEATPGGLELVDLGQQLARTINDEQKDLVVVGATGKAATTDDAGRVMQVDDWDASMTKATLAMLEGGLEEANGENHLAKRLAHGRGLLPESRHLSPALFEGGEVAHEGLGGGIFGCVLLGVGHPATVVLDVLLDGLDWIARRVTREDLKRRMPDVHVRLHRLAERHLGKGAAQLARGSEELAGNGVGALHGRVDRRVDVHGQRDGRHLQVIGRRRVERTTQHSQESTRAGRRARRRRTRRRQTRRDDERCTTGQADTTELGNTSKELVHDRQESVECCSVGSPQECSGRADTFVEGFEGLVELVTIDELGNVAVQLSKSVGNRGCGSGSEHALCILLLHGGHLIDETTDVSVVGQQWVGQLT